MTYHPSRIFLPHIFTCKMSTYIITKSPTYCIHSNFEGLIFCGRQVSKDFCSLLSQIIKLNTLIVSLSYCCFSRIKIYCQQAYNEIAKFTSLENYCVYSNYHNSMYLQVNAYITGIKLHMIMTDREFDQNYHNMHNPLIANKMTNLLCSKPEV